MDEAMILRAMGCLACAAAVICIPMRAQSEGQSDDGAFAVALEYSAAPGCADENDFKAIVVGRLGYEAFRADAQDRVLVDIVSRGKAFEGHIERRNAEGRWAGDRTFPSRSDDCGQLGRAMAFALALQIQLSAKASASPASSQTAGPTETASTLGTPASPIPAPLASTRTPLVPEAPLALTNEPAASNRAPRPTLNIGGGGLLGLGLSSSAVPLGRVFGSLAWQHSSFEVAAEVAWPTTTRREDGAGFSQQLLLISGAGCAQFQRWSTCLLAKAGEIRILGKDIDKPKVLSGPIVETGLRLALVQPLGRHLYVAARAEGLINVTRWRVTLDQNLVWTSPRFATTVGLDIGVRFLRNAPSENAIVQVAGGRDE
jgi:hypothetical protein